MCTRRATLHWTRVKTPKGIQRMSPHWCSVLILFLCFCSAEMVVAGSRPARCHSYQMERGQKNIQDLKRHSDGTFTSDLTRFLDRIKAKDFVEWLANTKRNGCQEHSPPVAAGV